MKAFKVELLVIGFENITEEDIINSVDYMKLCTSVKSIQSEEIGLWSDDHPLNRRETADEEYQRVFAPSIRLKYVETIKYGDTLIFSDYNNPRKLYYKDNRIGSNTKGKMFVNHPGDDVEQIPIRKFIFPLHF
jgi:hypothetical protein